MEKELTKEMIGLDKISPSKLGDYEECPRLFYYRHWLGINLDQDRLHLDFGEAIHRAIESIYLEYDNHFGGGWSSGSFEPVKAKFLSSWKQHHVTDSSYKKFAETNFGKESGFKSKEDLYRYMRDDGLKMLQSYWNEKERMLVEYGHDFTEFETWMKCEIRNPSNKNEILPIPLNMRIDGRTRDKQKIGDFKTSKGKYNEEDSRKKIQGLSYCFGTLMLEGAMVKHFDYIVLRKDLKSDNRIEVAQLHYDEADMQLYYERVKSILTRIAGREFDRPLRGHAHWCQCLQYEKELSVSGTELESILKAIK